jgi:MFS family permease
VPTRLVTPVFAIVTLATLFYFMAVGVMIPALPRYIKGPLGGGNAAVGVAVGAFALAAVVTRPFVGRFGDRRGRRILMIVGPAVVALAVGLFPLATSLPALVALRVLQGLGEANFYVGAATIINDLAPAERRGEALSYFSVALYLGLALGPSLGEAVLSGDHYGRVWVVAAGFAVGATLVSLLVREPERAMAEAADRVPSRIVHPAAVLPGSVLALGLLGYAAFAAFVPLYVLTIGLSGSGPAFLVYAGITLGVRIFGARIPDRVGFVRSALVGTTLVAVGMAMMALVASPAGLYCATIALGFGTSLNFPALMSLSVASAPGTERGSVVGTFTAFFDLSQGAGTIALGAAAALTNYRGAFATAATSAALGVVVLGVGERRRGAARMTGCSNGATST